VNGEYLLSLDPYNFNTEEEYFAHHFPKEYAEKIRSYNDDEDIIKENFYKG
jgi:hypothetical protein